MFGYLKISHPMRREWLGQGFGGMCVSPASLLNVPNHRRPRGMQKGSTGPPTDFVYAIADASIPIEKLALTLDLGQPEMHAFVEPAILVELSAYEADLADTRSDWRKVWP